jgi:hypothetical protein
MWKEVLSARYEEGVLSSSCVANFSRPSQVSIWRWDLRKFQFDDWIEGIVRKKVGNCDETHFGEIIWIGDKPLGIAFPIGTINQVGDWVSESWHLNLKWRRSLFLWEEDICKKFARCSSTGPSISTILVMCRGMFTVNSMYIYLFSFQ